jgi:trk system potassium uptake protein TrkA
MKTAIIGGGRVGRRAAETLSGQGHNVVVVEPDGDRCSQISSEMNITVIRGDGTDRSVLNQIPISDSDVLLALTGDTAVNLSACLISNRINEDIRTVLRVDDKNKRNQYSDMVDVTVFPEEIAGEMAANTIQKAVDTSGSIFGRGNLTFTTVEVDENAPAVGKKVKNLAIPNDSRIVASEQEIVDGDTVIKSGERYVVVTRVDNSDGMIQLLRG